ncbi:MAG: DUF2178 domain-containing protein [Candidatus Pacearchaeota archaeon]|jgi:uncharacterized membrane protein
MVERKNTKYIGYRYGFSLIIIIFGIILSYMNIEKDFLGFSSVGTWLIYVGFIMLVVITLQLLNNKKRIVDERMIFVSTKASRITFIAIILFSFIIMVIDGIKTINIPYSYFMSYYVCGVVLVYSISYKILSRYS